MTAFPSNLQTVRRSEDSGRPFYPDEGGCPHRPSSGVTGQQLRGAYVDQGYTDSKPAAQAAQTSLGPLVVKLPQAKPSFVLLPRRPVVEPSFAWLYRVRRPGRNNERLAPAFVGFPRLAFLSLSLNTLLR